MAEGATIKARLEKVTNELSEETKIWNDKQWDVTKYRMGHAELYVRCEVIAIYKLMKDKLDVSEDEFTLYLRTAVLDQMRELRKNQDEIERQQIRQRLTQGISIVPPKNLKNGEV